MFNIWHIVNSEKMKLANIDPCNLKIDDIYIVEYKNEKYRGKLIYFLHGSQEKYKVKYFFIYSYIYITTTFSITVFIDRLWRDCRIIY